MTNKNKEYNTESMFMTANKQKQHERDRIQAQITLARVPEVGTRAG